MHTTLLTKYSEGLRFIRSNTEIPEHWQQGRRLVGWGDGGEASHEAYPAPFLKSCAVRHLDFRDVTQAGTCAQEARQSWSAVLCLQHPLHAYWCLWSPGSLLSLRNSDSEDRDLYPGVVVLSTKCSSSKSVFGVFGDSGSCLQHQRGGHWLIGSSLFWKSQGIVVDEGMGYGGQQMYSTDGKPGKVKEGKVLTEGPPV